jgi:hypothetical protein
VADHEVVDGSTVVVIALGDDWGGRWFRCWCCGDGGDSVDGDVAIRTIPIPIPALPPRVMVPADAKDIFIAVALIAGDDAEAVAVAVAPFFVTWVLIKLAIVKMRYTCEQECGQWSFKTKPHGK